MRKMVGIFYLNNGDLLERVKAEKMFSLLTDEISQAEDERQAIVRDIITSTTKLVKFENGTTVELIPITNVQRGKKFTDMYFADSLTVGQYKEVASQITFQLVKDSPFQMNYNYSDHIFVYDKEGNYNKYKK